MIEDIEFEKLKKEHNKVAMWIEFFSHKLADMEHKIKELKKEADITKEKEELLARTVLKLVKEKDMPADIEPKKKAKKKKTAKKKASKKKR
jgi:hypothetical protein